MPLKGCRCRMCRYIVDGDEVLARVNARGKLSPESERALEAIVRAAYRQLKKTRPTDNSSERP